MFLFPRQNAGYKRRAPHARISAKHMSAVAQLRASIQIYTMVLLVRAPSYEHPPYETGRSLRSVVASLDRVPDSPLSCLSCTKLYRYLFLSTVALSQPALNSAPCSSLSPGICRHPQNGRC